MNSFIFVISRMTPSPPSALASHFLPMRNGSNDAMAQSSLALNPYMITSNQSYGLQLNELKKMNAMLEKDEIFEETKSQMKDDDATTTEKDDTSQSHNQNTNLSFLYTRESDRIGEGVQLSNYPLAKQFRQKNKRRKPLASEDTTTDVNGPVIQTKDQVRDLLKEYNHSPKVEHPLYTTTGNAIGIKKPEVATYNSERHSRSQTFSRSFNSMFSDQGLTL